MSESSLSLTERVCASGRSILILKQPALAEVWTVRLFISVDRAVCSCEAERGMQRACNGRCRCALEQIKRDKR